MNSNINIGDFEKLSDSDLFGAILKIKKLFSKNRCYIVGGAVRDALLGLSITDYDIEIFDISIEKIDEILKKNFETQMVGKHYCVLKLKGINIDVSVPRSEEKIGDKHGDFATKELVNASVKEAAKRRDFTINSIYFDIQNNKTIDQYFGIKDLNDKVLRHTSDKFTEDPLRVLRGMQFCGRFGLTADKETLKYCRQLSIDFISKERIFDEFRKLILKSTAPSKGLQFLKDSGWVKFFPEIEDLIGCEQESYYHPEGDVFEHICLVMDAFAKTKIGDIREDLVVGFASLCHDFGKPAVVNGHISNTLHAELGVAKTINFLQNIGSPKWLIKEIVPLVEFHMLPRTFSYRLGIKSEILHLANSCGNIERLVRLAKNDAFGRKLWAEKYSTSSEDFLLAEAKRLNVYNKKPNNIITGKTLVSLGLNPNRNFTDILQKCYDAQLDYKFDDIVGGIAFLQASGYIQNL